MNPEPDAARAAYPTATSTEEFAANIAAVRARIGAAATRSGRDAGEVRLLPVSKTVPEERLRLAVAAGATFLGENKVQEAQRKAESLADIPDLKWAVIGHLQTNKAKYVARFAAEFQALDSIRVAEALQRRLEIEDRTLDVYVQVNTSEEDSKFGLPPEQTASFIAQLPAFDRVRVKGLMTLAVFSDDLDRVRHCFVLLRTLRDQLRQAAPDSVDLTGLSMGMSGDFETAVEEGATTVRVGQAIFGSRALPDSYYWPGGTGSAAE
ncbi:hypothetical protein SAMN04489806_3309 [Paramicrobacterium humi]|uniref:Pyridoxal phosphate homeostasis protein n=1 Tax=Paramicrobacterium humi TaxID=640635 RepID=A0A1H4TU78_9MICO|nr:YggS family pyridoxal phosphate-dependent enzyme [Microbacterium humi]SEC59594.1 hypothetical protein SAMN04489806_3309 [Microbacterium humi]